ncbi:mediator of RNA polymerase II transcription subunit 9 isoform X1 [Arvicanthis niloticus]|uniref:mediator of RNA polymerase II transcription subunit 9 isoform X1 n=1 Tax=Arvicanthis niloticus TaxID=61156 RepID=UPI00402B8ECF
MWHSYSEPLMFTCKDVTGSAGHEACKRNCKKDRTQEKAARAVWYCLHEKDLYIIPQKASCPSLKLSIQHVLCSCSWSMDKDSPDLHQDLNALKTKFQEMRKLIGTMPGIHVSPEQQQQQLHSLREQVRTKNELLQKYKSLCMFEIPKE